MTVQAVKTPSNALVDDVIGVIRDLARTADVPRDLAKATLTAETTLESLGLDSLAKMTLLSALDEHLGIDIPDGAVTETTTIGSLVARVAKSKGLLQ